MLGFDQEFIKKVWFCFGILLMMVSFCKNIKLTRIIACLIFFVFILIASCRSINFNNDIQNYISHFQTMKSASLGFKIFLAWLFEPGYNLIVFLLSRFCDEKWFLFFDTFLPGLLFCYTFWRYSYSPQVIFFIYATIILIASTTTMRHFWAMAIAFWVLNRVLSSRHTKKSWFYFLPVFFHFSSLPFSGVLILDKYKKNFTLKKMIVVFFVMLLVVFILSPFWKIIVAKLIDRATSFNEKRGLRNLLNFLIIFLIISVWHKNFQKISLRPVRLDFLLNITFFASLILLCFPGINRIVSFFVLILCFYFNYYCASFNVNIKHILLNISSFLSLIYFYCNWKWM